MLGRVGVEPPAERRAELLLEVARIFEHEVGDLAKAFTALLAALQGAAAHRRWRVERAGAAGPATGMWSELLSELAEVMPTLPDGDRAPRPGCASRSSTATSSTHAEYALTSLDEALKLEPTLRRGAGAARLAAASALERWSELAEALGRSAERFVEQAELYESHLGDGAQAAAAYRAGARGGSAAARGARGARGAPAPPRRVARAGRGARRARRSTPPAKRCARSGARRRRCSPIGSTTQAGDRALRGARQRGAARPDDAARARAALRGRRAGAGVPRVSRAAGRGGRERPRARRALPAHGRRVGGASRAARARAEECLEKLLAVDARSEDALRSLERLYSPSASGAS